jgi:hypothetical protein
MFRRRRALLKLFPVIVRTSFCALFADPVLLLFERERERETFFESFLRKRRFERARRDSWIARDALFAFVFRAFSNGGLTRCTTPFENAGKTEENRVSYAI